MDDRFHFLYFPGGRLNGFLAGGCGVFELVRQFGMFIQQLLQQMKRPAIGGVDLRGGHITAGRIPKLPLPSQRQAEVLWAFGRFGSVWIALRQ